GESLAYHGNVTTGVPGLALRGGELAGGAAKTETRLPVGPERLQLLGVRFAEAKVQPLTRQVRAAGLVEQDNTRQADVTLRYSGYVEKQFRGRIGDDVKQGTPLMTVYSPDLIAAENEFLIAHGGME